MQNACLILKIFKLIDDGCLTFREWLTTQPSKPSSSLPPDRARWLKSGASGRRSCRHRQQKMRLFWQERKLRRPRLGKLSWEGLCPVVPPRPFPRCVFVGNGAGFANPAASRGSFLGAKLKRKLSNYLILETGRFTNHSSR